MDVGFHHIFSVSSKMIHLVFFFTISSVNYTDQSSNVKLTLLSWDKPHVVMSYYPFCSVGFNLLKNVLKDFLYLCPQEVLVFFFSYNVSNFSVRIMLSS